MDRPLLPEDDRLPAVRARLFLLVRSLWHEGILQLPLAPGADGAPALQLLRPLWRRLRVELLGRRLLRDIIPAIERQMAGEGSMRREESQLSPSAPIDWPATWRRALEQRTERPLVARRWERNLQLPENRLAWEALRLLATESRRALPASTSPQEAAALQELAEGARDRLRRPPWRAFSDQHTPPPLEAARERIGKRSHRPAYETLLDWWRQWHDPGQPTGGEEPLLDPALEADWLFELLLLFELVAAIARHLPTHQCRALTGDSRKPIFTSRCGDGSLHLYYQSGAMLAGQRSLSEIAGIPDIVIELPGEAPSYAILDAKNYGTSGHTQAIYKMLGYLYQYGYNPRGAHRFERVHAGILAFPTDEREGFCLRRWQEEQPDAQSVMSFVLPPLPDERYSGLEEFVTWLLARAEG